MPKAYKVLGQAAPAADTDTTLYTVPAGKSAVSSSLTICNRDAGIVAAYRVAVVPSGATLSNQHYINYDKPLNAADTIALVLGLTLAAGDKIVVRASSANVSFGLFGSEIS